jgi:hypothetical protein
MLQRRRPVTLLWRADDQAFGAAGVDPQAVVSAGQPAINGQMALDPGHTLALGLAVLSQRVRILLGLGDDIPILMAQLPVQQWV